MRATRGLRILFMVAIVLSDAAAADADAKAGGPSWVELSDNLSGLAGGISQVAVAPGTGTMLVGCVGKGLWSSADAGTTWAQVTAFPATKGDPSCFVFDPSDSATFWVACDDGMPSLFTSVDAGKTFKPCGNLHGVASVMEVASGPNNHRTFFVGMSRSERDAESGNGSFFSRNYQLPRDLGYTREVALVDAKIMLVGAHDQDPKAEKPHAFGIFRSDDGGRTWTKVSPAEPIGHALVLKDGSIFWPATDHLMRSHDQGLTWTPLHDALLAPMPLHDTWMAALGQDRLLLSSDGGDSWDAVGPEFPFPADGAVWDATHSRFVIWAKGGGSKGRLATLQAPDDLTTLVDPTLPRDLVAWNGDDKMAGGGWPDKPETSLKAESAVARQGQGAMQWHVATAGFFTNAGWVWGAYPLKDTDSVDASGEKTVVLSLKLVDNSKNPPPADGKPAPGLPGQLTFCLNALANGHAGDTKATVDLIALAPKLPDGKWHDVAIPLSSFPNLDTKSLIGFTWTAHNGSGQFSFDLYIDDIGFAK